MRKISEWMTGFTGSALSPRAKKCNLLNWPASEFAAPGFPVFIIINKLENSSFDIFSDFMDICINSGGKGAQWLRDILGKAFLTGLSRYFTVYLPRCRAQTCSLTPLEKELTMHESRLNDTVLFVSYALITFSCHSFQIWHTSIMIFDFFPGSLARFTFGVAPPPYTFRSSAV